MITVGLPKGLFYFEHHILWEQFFRNLGCSIVTSRDTNKQILDDGVRCCCNETCLPVKVFHGHVYSLKNAVDYVFIPRYTSLDENEYVCPKFCGLPDMALLYLKRQIRVLEVRVHMDLFPVQTFDSLMEISHIVKIGYAKVLSAFKEAGEVFRKHIEGRQDTREYGSEDYGRKPDTTKTALAVLGHPYMTFDRYLSMNLIEKLERQSITVCTPKDLDHETKRKNAYPFQGKVFWNVGFELLGSAFTFARDPRIKGLIYITPFACGVDAFILEMIERRLKSHYDIPLLKLTVDEHTGEAGFDTRLEAFLDMVG